MSCEGQHSTSLELTGPVLELPLVKTFISPSKQSLSKFLCLEQLASQSPQIIVKQSLKVISLGHESFSTKDKAGTCSSR